MDLFAYELMPNHYPLLLKPLVDGDVSRFMGWVSGTHTMRYDTHYHTGGMGHFYQQRYMSFPIQDDDHFLVVCRYVERNALRAGLRSTTHREERRYVGRLATITSWRPGADHPNAH